MAAAAKNLAAIRSSLGAANKAAAAPTAGVFPPGGDQVSAVIAAMFGVHAQAYQAMGAQATEFHDKFVQALQTSAGAYASTEATNARPMQQALGNAVAGLSSSNGSGGAAGHGAPPPSGPAAASGPHGDAGAGATPASNGGGAGPGGGGTPVAVGGGDGSTNVAAGNGGGSHVGAGFSGSGTVADPGPSGTGVGGSPGAGTAVGATGTPLPNGGWWGGGAGSPTHAGLSGHSAADSGTIAGMGVPTAPAAPPAPASPAAAAEPDLSMAPKAQPVQAAIPALAGHPDSLARSGNVADTDRDKLPQLIPVPLPSLRGLRKKLKGLRLRDEREEEEGGLRKPADEERSSRPATPEELLAALGLRPPGHE
jgi:hypothetical protein